MGEHLPSHCGITGARESVASFIKVSGGRRGLSHSYMPSRSARWDAPVNPTTNSASPAHAIAGGELGDEDRLSKGGVGESCASPTPLPAATLNRGGWCSNYAGPSARQR